MKIKIRSGVFETNSSSTHSFTILTKQEKEERKKMHDKKLEECKNKAKEMKDVETAKFFMYKEENKLQREYIECYASSEEKLPIQKLLWFEDLIENAENKESFWQYYEPLSDDEFKNILIERLKNYFNEEFKQKERELKTEIAHCEAYDVEMLLWKLWVFDNQYDSFVGRYPQLWDSLHYYNILKLDVECMHDALINECCRLDNIKREEFGKRHSIKENKKSLYEKKVGKCAENLYKNDKKFRDYVDGCDYKDMVQAFKNYTIFIMDEKIKKHGDENKHQKYFGNGEIDDCNNEYIDIISIYLKIIGIKNKISKIKNKEVSYEEFAKEFLSDKYNVYWTNGFDDRWIV